mmetsp:Transcript_24321/g.54146  ORF Transcript_24321/g.54146 Transcript_24321/m.54146 type:complete len:314 (-) Transcript_24321:187-1128(-)
MPQLSQQRIHKVGFGQATLDADVVDNTQAASPPSIFELEKATQCKSGANEAVIRLAGCVMRHAKDLVEARRGPQLQASNAGRPESLMHSAVGHLEARGYCKEAQPRGAARNSREGKSVPINVTEGRGEARILLQQLDLLWRGIGKGQSFHNLLRQDVGIHAAHGHDKLCDPDLCPTHGDRKILRSPPVQQADLVRSRHLPLHCILGWLSRTSKDRGKKLLVRRRCCSLLEDRAMNAAQRLEVDGGQRLLLRHRLLRWRCSLWRWWAGHRARCHWSARSGASSREDGLAQLPEAITLRNDDESQQKERHDMPVW